MTDKPTAYDRVGWDKLSPYAKQQIDQLAERNGIILHSGTDYETLRRLVAVYRASW